jgi:hypothetical protein
LFLKILIHTQIINHTEATMRSQAGLGLFVGIFLVSIPGMTGCGRRDLPPLGMVSGNVILDNQPLVGVSINFKPEVGRAATATTDAKGNYELLYVYGVKGCKIGPNTVMFEWPLEESGRPIPRRYVGLDSELKVEVQKGRNKFDFDLKS